MKTLSIAMSLSILAGVGAITFQNTPSQGRVLEVLEDDGQYPPIRQASQTTGAPGSNVVRVGISPDVPRRLRDVDSIESPQAVLVGRRVFGADDQYFGRVDDVVEDANGFARILVLENASGESGRIPAARATYDARHNVVILDVAVDPFSS